MRRIRVTRRRLGLVSLVSVAVVLVGVLGGFSGSAGAQGSSVTTSSLGTYSPTFYGPANALNGCTGCTPLLSDPITTTLGDTASAARASRDRARVSRRARTARPRHHGLPAPVPRRSARASRRAAMRAATDPTFTPTVSCQPLGPGCDNIDTSQGGATGVNGLKAVDSASLSTNLTVGDIEPPDQGLCAGNGYVVETNNIGEILVFNTALSRLSAPISLDTVMGLTGLGWSSGGDPSCEYDSQHGGHWFFTEIVSASSEQNQGPFTGCFVGAASTCYEGIAVSKTSNPFGPYYVYFMNANYNPSEAGYPSLLNDFAKIGVTRDAFMLFYDEFPLKFPTVPGVGGGFFNGAQELVFDKSALESGLPAADVNVAIENMGLIPTPNGPCDTGTAATSGIDCWGPTIPAQPADSGQYDNSHGGSGFMMDALDFTSFAGVTPSSGDDRIAVWDWTGLDNLTNNPGSIRFSGTLFSGVNSYSDPGNALGVGFLGAQKAGPIPLGAECGAAGLSVAVGKKKAPKSCPEGGIESNTDTMTQVSQAQGELWAPLTTEVNQTFGSASEVHEGVAYYVIGTRSFDSSGGSLTLDGQGYVSAAHEDLEFPAMAAEGTGGSPLSVMTFTLNGNGGPSKADNGGFYPSTAYGRLTPGSTGLLGSAINIADLGQSPQDGFSEYAGYPPTAATRPRWGDYSWAIFLPNSGNRIYFANNYIQYPNCTGKAFTLTIGTCGGTRDGFANWGTSVNYVVP